MTLGPLARALADAPLRALLGLPGALVRWWLGPWTLAPVTRDDALQLAVGVGGALLLAYAAWAHGGRPGAPRASAAQVRGLAMAGAGFLTSAGASAALRAHGPLGGAVSLAGALLVLKASLLLVRERQATRDRDRGSR